MPSRLALVVNLSGGKDSTRMLGYVRSRFPDVTTYCVMADTGFEHVRPIPAAEWSRQIAARFGMVLHVVRNPNKTYLEMVRARGKFPSAQFRQCTSDLKTRAYPEVSPPTAASGARQLHGNARTGIGSACTADVMVNNDVRMIHQHDREAFDLMSDLEQQSGFTMKAGRSLVQANREPISAHV